MPKKQGNVTLVRLTVDKAEFSKLTPREKKRYLMLSCILRDLNVLQKCLVYIENTEPAGLAPTSAQETGAVFFMTTLVSKVDEMWNFLRKNAILNERASFSNELGEKAQKIEKLFSDQKVSSIFSFIRNKFGFHYEHWDDIDSMVEAAILSLAELEVWLSSVDSGNDIFASSNKVIVAVILQKMRSLGYVGTDQELVGKITELALDAASDFREFSHVYLAEVFPVKWQEKQEVQLQAPIISDVTLPMIVARGPAE